MKPRRPHPGPFGNQRAWPKKLTREERKRRTRRNQWRGCGWKVIGEEEYRLVRVPVPPNTFPDHAEGVARLKTLFVVG